MQIDEHGTLLDVRWNGLGDQAGLAPKQRITEVNGTPYSTEALRAALGQAKTNPAPLKLMAEQEGDKIPVEIDYHGVQRYPVLTRAPELPDYLEAITKPLVVSPSPDAR